MPYHTIRTFAALMCVALLADAASAVDIVHRKSTEKTLGGEITKNTRDGVTVTQQVGNREETVTSNDITYIEWDAEPGPAKLARGSESTGNLDEAVKQYQEAVKATAASKDGLKIDVQFGLARASAKRAIRTGEELPAAAALVKSFVTTYRDNYRFFDGQLLLGDLSLATQDFAAAEAAFQTVTSAPWPDYQMSGKLGAARAQLGRKDVAKARQIFDEIAGMATKTPAEESRKLEAMLGQAMCLAQQSDNTGAGKLIEKVIDTATPNDARVQAEAYIRQGDVLQADGKSAKAAVRAYLHVDVIPEFSTERDLHAESLYQLARLWPTVGEAERGADAATRLKAQYPTSEWAKKLAGK